MTISPVRFAAAQHPIAIAQDQSKKAGAMVEEAFKKRDFLDRTLSSMSSADRSLTRLDMQNYTMEAVKAQQIVTANLLKWMTGQK